MGQEQSLAALVAALSALAHCGRGQALKHWALAHCGRGQALDHWALAHCGRGQALEHWAEARGRPLEGAECPP